MKKNLQNLFLAIVVGGMLALSSCSKDEPLPATIPDFAVTSFAPEVAIPVKFDNLSLNASYYVWEYGDGTVDSATTISPSHVYDEPGEYTVTLRSYNEDNEFMEVKKEVSVGERYLVAAAILNIDMLDQDSMAWDSDETGPDVIFDLGPIDATSIDEIVRAYIEDLNTGEITTPVFIENFESFQPIPNDFVLSDETFFLELNDLDTVDDETVFQNMISIEFNPITLESEQVSITSTKDPDGSGLIQIPFVVVGNFQIVLFFEVM